MQGYGYQLGACRGVFEEEVVKNRFYELDCLKRYMDLLFHYTRLECFKNMLEGDNLSTGEPCLTFWASSAFNMDDQIEMNFGYPLILSVLDEYEKKGNITDEQRLSSILTEIPSHINGPNNKFYLTESNTPFVLSFSRNYDSDYMWNIFADKGRGICLIFDSEELYGLAHKWKKSYFLDVAYLVESNIDYEIWEALVNVIINEANKCHLLMPRLKNKDDILPYKKYVMNSICPVISALIKDGDYLKENEVRWISIQDARHAKSRVCNGKDKMYIEVKIPLSYLKGIMYSPKFEEIEDLNSLIEKHNLIITPAEIKFK